MCKIRMFVNIKMCRNSVNNVNSPLGHFTFYYTYLMVVPMSSATPVLV